MDKIAVITGSRAEYWLLRPLMRKLKEAGELKLLVTGENYEGPGLKKVKEDGFLIDQKAECLTTDDTYLGLVKAISRGINNFAEALVDINPSIVILLGDRYETFAAASAAYSLKIPIAHIHGGEVTHGALDEGYRHTISKMAHLHFVSHEEYKKRLVRMGENPSRIHVVGAIGLDNLPKIDSIEKNFLAEKYPFLEHGDYFLVTLHSSTLSNETPDYQGDAVIKALEYFPEYNVVITKSNSDPGGIILNKKWKLLEKECTNIFFIPNLGDDYLNISCLSKIVIGNSSSGILEIPYLDCPVLNIGSRQDGRIFPKGVYCSDFDVDNIKKSIKTILNTYRGSEKIYGEPGMIAENIFKILQNTTTDNLIYKSFYDAEK